MDKLQRLKKKLLRQGSICAVILAFVSAGLFAVHSYYTTTEEAQRKNERELRRIQGNIAQLENKFDIYESSFSTFESISKQLQDDTFYLDIDAARTILNGLRKRHRITNLNLVITPQEQFTLKDIDVTHYKPVFREVTLTFSALSDAHVYAFIDAIKQYFNGFLRFTNVSIKQTRPLSDTILREVQRGSTPAMTDAKLVFLWIGIEPIEVATQ